MKRAPKIVPTANRPAGWVVQEPGDGKRYLRIARTRALLWGALALATVFGSPSEAETFGGAVWPVYTGVGGYRYVHRQRTPSPPVRAVCPECAATADHDGGIPHKRLCSRRKKTT